MNEFLTSAGTWMLGHPWPTLALAAAAAVAVVLIRVVVRAVFRTAARGVRAALKVRRGSSWAGGTTLAYVAAVVAMGGSAVTSWQFFGDKVGIENVYERAFLFGVLELSLLACSVAMRANVRNDRPVGIARVIAWALCALSAGFAWAVSGVLVGTVRVAAGPVLYLVMFHLALGIEIKARSGKSGVLARVAAEIRERLLSRLGLGNEQRDALALTRQRAARRAAVYALNKPRIRGAKRYAKALRVSNAAHDECAMDELLSELAVLRFADSLATLKQDSPFDAAIARTTGRGNVGQDVVADEAPADEPQLDEQIAAPIEDPAPRNAIPHRAPELEGLSKAEVVLRAYRALGGTPDELADEQVLADARSQAPQIVAWAADHGVLIERTYPYDVIKRHARKLRGARANVVDLPTAAVAGGEAR